GPGFIVVQRTTYRPAMSSSREHPGPPPFDTRAAERHHSAQDAPPAARRSTGQSTTATPGDEHMATSTVPDTGLQLRSLVKKDGTLELSLVGVPTPEPKPEEVIVRMEASPINPSDQGLLFAGADMSAAKASGTPQSPVVTATVPPAALKGLAGRVDQSLP